MNKIQNDVTAPLADRVTDTGLSRRGERHVLPILAIICYVAVIVSAYAPWYLLGTDGATPELPTRSMWNNGLNDWGESNSIVLLAVIGVCVTCWRVIRHYSTAQRATAPLFFALFIFAARQLMAYGAMSSGWHGRFITHEVGWRLTLILVASTVGAVVSMRWLFITQFPIEAVAVGDEPGPREAPKVTGTERFLRALIVLTIVATLFSLTT